MKTHAQYSLFWNRRGERKYFRATTLSFTKASAVQAFQPWLMAPFTKPGWPVNIATSLRRCEGIETVGWPDEVKNLLGVNK